MTARRTIPLLLLLAAGLAPLALAPPNAQAQQIYAMGSQKLSGMFGPNPCPNVPKP